MKFSTEVDKVGDSFNKMLLTIQLDSHIEIDASGTTDIFYEVYIIIYIINT